MPDISVAVALLKKPIAAVASFATGKARDALASAKADARIKIIYQKLNATQKVKTIWDVDKARSLSAFYYPAKIQSQSGSKQLLSNLDELPSNAVILSGTVGQGKSILLRHLLGMEMKSGTRIPLFVELRKVPTTGIDRYLQQLFSELLDIDGHPEIFTLFAEQGKISLLLDGFDEVDPNQAKDLMASVERLVLRFPQARVVVTSRPTSGIETSPLFDVVHIAPLSDSDFSGFFNKILSRDRALAGLITTAVMQSKSVKLVASTPLLATLLTIVYRSTQRIPTDFAEFYDQLFQILLVRHDRSKAYSRQRRTNLGDREIQEAFEAFCFKAHDSGRPVIEKLQALEISKKSIAARELTCLEDDFLSDVIKVTCLLQEDGNQVEFVHQSVREFFAAKYVSSRPDEIVKQFFYKLGTKGNWRKWDQVVNFLSQLDRYRTSQFYLIPMTHRFLKLVHSDSSLAAPPRLREISSHAGVKKNEKKQQPDKRANFVAYRNYPDDSPHWENINTQLFQLFFGPSGIATNRWVGAFDSVTLGQSKNYTEIAVYCGTIPALDKFLTSFVTGVRLNLTELETSAQVVDSSGDFMDL